MENLSRVGVGTNLSYSLMPYKLITTGTTGKVKSCYNPLRLGTEIVLVSSGIDFVNTPHLYSDRATS